MRIARINKEQNVFSSRAKFEHSFENPFKTIQQNIQDQSAWIDYRIYMFFFKEINTEKNKEVLSLVSSNKNLRTAPFLKMKNKNITLKKKRIGI